MTIEEMQALLTDAQDQLKSCADQCNSFKVEVIELRAKLAEAESSLSDSIAREWATAKKLAASEENYFAVCERLQDWMNAFGFPSVGAAKEEHVRIKSKLAEVERQRDMWKHTCESIAEKLNEAERQNTLMREALEEIAALTSGSGPAARGWSKARACLRAILPKGEV